MKDVKRDERRGLIKALATASIAIPTTGLLASSNEKNKQVNSHFSL